MPRRRYKREIRTIARNSGSNLPTTLSRCVEVMTVEHHFHLLVTTSRENKIRRTLEFTDLHQMGEINLSSNIKRGDTSMSQSFLITAKVLGEAAFQDMIS